MITYSYSIGFRHFNLRGRIKPRPKKAAQFALLDLMKQVPLFRLLETILRLCVTHKALQLPVFVFSFSFLSVFWTD